MCMHSWLPSGSVRVKLGNLRGKGSLGDQRFSKKYAHDNAHEVCSLCEQEEKLTNDFASLEQLLGHASPPLLLGHCQIADAAAELCLGRERRRQESFRSGHRQHDTPCCPLTILSICGHQAQEVSVALPPLQRLPEMWQPFRRFARKSFDDCGA